MKISLSICTYKDGTFEVIFRHPESSREVTLTGTQKIEGGDFDFINEIAPACVWTEYQRAQTA